MGDNRKWDGLYGGGPSASRYQLASFSAGGRAPFRASGRTAYSAFVSVHLAKIRAGLAAIAPVDLRGQPGPGLADIYSFLIKIY